MSDGTTEATDDELVDRLLRGDERAFTALVGRHEGRVYALAFRMLGERQDALDATQEAFLSAFRQIHRFRRDAAFSTWLYRIAVNASHDVLRKRKRLVVVEEVDVPDEHAESPDDSAVRRIDLRRALAALPPEYREAVVLHDLGGVPYEEIARLTSTALGTVKSRISRGRKQLASSLEQVSTVEESNL